MSFEQLIKRLKADFPEYSFQSSNTFSWNSKNRTVSYFSPEDSSQEARSTTQLLHELAHARLNHSNYKSDVELLKTEADAWSLAQDLAKEYKIKLSKKEQNLALGSYINWASSRSCCPECKKNGLQKSQTVFLCLNCSRTWRVSRSRFTRTYRQN